MYKVLRNTTRNSTYPDKLGMGYNSRAVSNMSMLECLKNSFSAVRQDASWFFDCKTAEERASKLLRDYVAHKEANDRMAGSNLSDLLYTALLAGCYSGSTRVKAEGIAIGSSAFLEAPNAGIRVDAYTGDNTPTDENPSRGGAGLVANAYQKALGKDYLPVAGRSTGASRGGTSVRSAQALYPVETAYSILVSELADLPLSTIDLDEYSDGVVRVAYAGTSGSRNSTRWTTR